MVLTSTLMDQVQEMIAVSHSVRCKLFIFIEFSRNSWSALSVLVLILCCWSAPVLGFLVFYISFTDSVFRSTRNSLIRSLIRVSTVDLKLSLTCNYSFNHGFIFNPQFQSHIYILNEFLNAGLIKMQMEELLKIKSERYSFSFLLDSLMVIICLLEYDRFCSFFNYCFNKGFSQLIEVIQVVLYELRSFCYLSNSNITKL